jgi:hypothetical protein
MGLHIDDIDPTIGQKPTDFEDDPCMVYTRSGDFETISLLLGLGVSLFRVIWE